jgi:hypothetical protein
MRRGGFAVVVIAVGATACAARGPRTQPVPAERFSFAARSNPDSLLEASFEGTAIVHDGWISVDVARSSVTFPPGLAENWRSLRMRSFVAADFGAGAWKAPAASTAQDVWQFIDFASGPSSTTRRSLPIGDTLHFLVPIPPGASLATSRLAFETEWVVLFGSYGQIESRFAFAPITATARPAR